MFDEARAQRAVRIFESLRHTKGKFYGQPFVLLPWERKIVEDVYGTLDRRGLRQYKYIYVEIPKKQGKSELAAAAGIYHLFADGERNGEVYGCAADRGQASLVFDVAVDMIDQAPALRKRAKYTASKKRITDKVTGSFYQVLSAEAYTKHGLNVSACIFDELHAQPNRGLWDVMTFGAGDARQQPIWWIITTAGDDPDRVTVGWEQHEYARAILAGEIVDPTWYPVIYAYEGDDIYNEANWALANPSLGQTITLESVREAAEKAKVRPADERLFRWLRLNQWITTKLTSWLPLDLFDQTVGEWSRADQLGKACYLGLDLSSTTDLTALAVLFPPQDTQLDWRVFWHCWLPKNGIEERVKNDKIPYDRWAAQGYLTLTDGDVIDYTVIEKTILEIKKFYKVQEIPADRAMAAMLIQRLEQKGLTCVDVPQTYTGLTDPMNQVEILLKGQAGWQEPPTPDPSLKEGESQEDIPVVPTDHLLRGRMTHEDNPVARWCFGNTSIAKNGQGYIKFVKEHKGKSVDRTKRIDLTAAWVNAMARARFWSGRVDISAEILSDDWGM
jgi:phage terminase large subunit-like protein